MASDVTGFAPNGAHARMCDRNMHAALRDSLAHLHDVLGSRGVEPTGIEQVIAQLDAGERFAPLGFALYYDLASAVFVRDHDAAAELAERLTKATLTDDSIDISAHLEEAPHEVAERLNGSEGEGGMRLAPITAEARDAFVDLLHEGFDLMRRELPALHDEVTTLVRQIVLAQAPAGSKLEFDGASHYQYWGLLMLNPKHHKTPLDIVEVLAHEAGHSLLFGQTIEEPLVFNPDDELYTSPLRVDQRPMDGIYHATFVSARMAWAMERLAQSDRLTADERKAAADAAAKDRQNFKAGDSVVAEHGRLSATGARIMDAARDYMARSESDVLA